MEQPISYAINISHDGVPFYIQAVKRNDHALSVYKSYNRVKGMYFLFLRGVLVYLGISQRNCHKRIYSHTKDKDFDSYFILSCEDGDNKTMQQILDYEIILIKKFKPRYNSQGCWKAKLLEE